MRFDSIASESKTKVYESIIFDISDVYSINHFLIRQIGTGLTKVWWRFDADKSE